MRTRKRRLGMGVVLVAALAAAGVAAIAPTAVAQREPGKLKANDRLAVSRLLQRVNFIGNCMFSHRNTDDPIVFPNMAGASHDHSFVGNRTTNAFSTVDSLLGGRTTCRRSGETAAYWMPTLYVDGNAVSPTGATIYYRRKTLQQVQSTPPGFRMIAGDATTQTAQHRQVTFWNCGAMIGIPASSTPPACPDTRGSFLRLHVTFPACWNGVSLDSPNHKQHVAYQMNGRCPAGYDVAIPQISLIYRYAITGQHSFELASGGVYSAHADFFNAWNQAELERLTQFCLNGLRHCGNRLVRQR